MPLKIIGSPLSPYVRKVLACLRHKGLEWQIDPIVPFHGNDHFTALSPLRRIPVLIDGDVVICDSTVICEYLEEQYPDHPLYPVGIADRARVRWLEEYADTRMGDVFIWRFFNQLTIRQAVWGEPANKAVLDQALQVDIPGILDWLETQVPLTGFICGDITLADIAIASFFRNAHFVRFRTDPRKWPRVADHVDRTLSSEPLAGLRPMENLLLRSPPSAHRQVLAGMGIPLTSDTLGESSPRRGIMAID